MTMPFDAIKPINMEITPASSIAKSGKSIMGAEEEGSSKFENLFLNYMNTANTTLTQAKDLGDKVATGDVQSLHKLSISGMKAEIMIKLTTQIASKLSSACSTMFQMQM